MNNEKIKECVKSVYIHIPFCNYICSYCDFCKMYYDENKIDKYLNALKEEIKNNYKGEIIGINQAIYNPDNNISNIGIGFATPINLVKEYLASMD